MTEQNVMTKMSGAELLTKWLQSRGVGFVSALSGNGLDPFLLASRKLGLRIIDTRNEQTASYIADGYARLTGKLGVCAVTSAVGLVNATIGLLNAYFDGAPVLLIAGASEQDTRGLGHFQELDHLAVVKPICKYTGWVERVELLEPSLEQAAGAALSGRPGPVHLTIPIDVMAADVEVEAGRFSGDSPSEMAIIKPEGGPGSLEEVKNAAQLLDEAKKPVIIAGTGAFYARAEKEVNNLVETADVPVMVPIWDRGVINRPIRQFVGVAGAASGEPELVGDSDLLVYIGARIDFRTGYARPPVLKSGCRIIRIDVDANELRQGRRPDVSILGSPREVVGQLIKEYLALGGKKHSKWVDEAQRRYREFRKRWNETPAAEPPSVTGRHVVDALRPFVSGDTLFLVDGGNIGQWAHMTLCDTYSANFLTCGTSGVVGWGMGGAMAARLAEPEKPVILLSGDGAATFNLMDLERAASHKLPFVMVLADDQAWGMVVSTQSMKVGKDNTCGCLLGPIRFDKLAESLGCFGIRAEKPEDIGPAIKEALKADRPAIVHVPIQTGSPTDLHPL
jgi:acetolactate synthase-1/2/3 large subunit